MAKDNRMVRVGDMLVTARVVSSADITEAIQVSKRLNIPIGRVLITSGCVTEKLLHAALDLQALIRDGEIPLDSALKALMRVSKSGCSVKESLEQLNVSPKYGKGKNDLADLLVDSNLVSQDQIDDALKTSFEYGTPLGSTLVFQGALSPNFFPSISAIQEKVANGELSNDEAIEELKAAFSLWLKAGDRTKQPALKTFEELAERQPSTHKKRRNEKLTEYIQALDDELDQKNTENFEPAMQALSEAAAQLEDAAGANKAGDLDETVQNSANDSEVEITPENNDKSDIENISATCESESNPSSAEESENLTAGTTSKERHSTEKLSGEKYEKRSTHPSMPEKSASRDKRQPASNRHARPGGRLIDLLSASGLLDQDTLPAAYQLMLQDTHRSATFLVESGLINEDLRRQAERCHNLVRRGRLSPEQAIRALKSSAENEMSLRDALSKEGVSQPTKIEKDWQTGVAAGVVGGFLAAFFSLVITILRLVKKR